MEREKLYRIRRKPPRQTLEAISPIVRLPPTFGAEEGKKWEEWEE